jgi:hypothetical protein
MQTHTHTHTHTHTQTRRRQKPEPQQLKAAPFSGNSPRTRASVGVSTTTRRAAEMTAAAELGVLLSGARKEAPLPGVREGVLLGTLWREFSVDAGAGAGVFLGGGVLCTSVNLTMPCRGSGITLMPSLEADEDVGAVNDDTPWLRSSKPRETRAEVT